MRDSRWCELTDPTALEGHSVHPGTPGHGGLISSGVDVVSVDRIADLVARFGESFLDRVYSDRERAYCFSQPRPPEHFAARWAAKEAAVKALSAGHPVRSLSEITVRREDGRPELCLAGSAERATRHLASEHGVAEDELRLSVSMSHDTESGVSISHVLVGYRHDPS